MADNANFKGLDKLNEFLQTLPVKMEKNIMRGALRAGANVVKDEAKVQLQSHGSVDTGQLSKGLRVSTGAKGGKVTASLKAKGKHGYLAQWIEFGVKPHGVKNGAKRKSGKYQEGKLHPGFVEKPFLRPALDGKSGAAVVAAGEYIKSRLTKEGLNTADIEIEEL